MKKIIRIRTVLAVALGIVFALSSCKKEEPTTINTSNNSTGGAQGPQSTFYCKVDGKDYQPPFTTGFRQTMIRNILITGSMGTGEDVQLFVNMNIKPGTYTFGDPLADVFNQALYQVNDTTGGFCEKDDIGELKITEHDTSAMRIKGTFFFKTSPSAPYFSSPVYSITEGRFEVYYEDI